MITLGLHLGHNASACLMIKGEIVGLVQEERMTKVKNQTGFPSLAIDELIKDHLEEDIRKIDCIAVASTFAHPYYICLNKYDNFGVEEYIKEMKEVWYPHFYQKKEINVDVWKNQYKKKINLNNSHNFDFSFLDRGLSLKEEIDYFSNVERKNAILRKFPGFNNIKIFDHHRCHAYYALYGGNLNQEKFKDTLILTADSWGDYKNWSVSVFDNHNKIKEIECGDNFLLARIYKFCTLILGMKPNEHEYKVMGLAGYNSSNKYVKKVEKIFFDILDFEDGSFTNKNPLIDSYYDLKSRLEGHRFDNIASALQNWCSEVLNKWVNYWVVKLNKKGVAFSGGLSMNIKANGDLLKNENIKWLSVPASGGDESLSAGACFYAAEENEINIKCMNNPYLGSLSKKDMSWQNHILNNDFKNNFRIIEDFDMNKVAQLLAKDHIVARCIGRAEFGARALGNRSILANPSNYDNIKKINSSIKNRDFWMPFTPSILEEYSKNFLINEKNISSPYMTIGFDTTTLAKNQITACLHMGDHSARPQFVYKNLNHGYWSLINEFYKITKIPCLLNTSLNLHGDPMNYTISDAIKTLDLSSLNFLMIPDNKLIYKKEYESILKNLLM